MVRRLGELWHRLSHDTFSTVPVVAPTATESKKDVRNIKTSLNMENPLEVIKSPNRSNIFYEKVLRKGEEIGFFKAILQPLADGLRLKKVDHPITILCLPLR